jgi:predicted DNA-binding protein YlxM (UPF0122 family)
MLEKTNMKSLKSKKGGPDTKIEKDTRQRTAFQLYFEEGFSARRIAVMLKKNRNTINEDIKKGYHIIEASLPKNSSSLILKQYERIENQRSRLMEILEKETDFNNKINLEKMITSIDLFLTNNYFKVATHSYVFSKQQEMNKMSNIYSS